MTESELIFAVMATLVVIALCGLVAIVIQEMGRLKGDPMTEINRCPDCTKQICPRCSGCKCSSTPCHCATLSSLERDVDSGEGEDWKKGGKQ